MSSMKAIETTNLTKYYGKSRGIEELNLTVSKGEFFGFIGPNGAGKSTTIRTLLGLIKCSSGSASVLGLDIEKDKESYKEKNIDLLLSSMNEIIEKNNLRAFLAADINNLDGDEDRLAKELGKINLLKVGHHGYDNSTTSDYIQALSPEFAVVTNRKNGISRTPLKNLNSVKAIVFETGMYVLRYAILKSSVEIISFIKILIAETFFNVLITIILYPLIQKTGHSIENQYKGNKILTRYF